MAGTRLEHDQEERARLAVADERARIARELHDVIAHSVSVMTVQAGAARLLLTGDPQRAVEPLLAVEETGRQALAEMRRLLGVLCEDAGEPDLAPQPGLTDLPRLATTVREAGLDDGRPTAVDGQGHGLLGMRERAALYGGELEAGPLPGGGYAVRARLPVESTPP